MSTQEQQTKPDGGASVSTDGLGAWISVKDKLPPSLEDVLLCFEPGGFFRRRIIVGYWWGGDENKWGPSIGRKFTVTHWMKLPEAPNVQDHRPCAEERKPK